MKLFINGVEIVTIEFDEDEIKVTKVKFSDFFNSLTTKEQIELLEAHGRTIEEDIELFKDPHRLKYIAAKDSDTGKLSDPDEETLAYFSTLIKSLIVGLRAHLRGEVLPENSEDLFKIIESTSFKGH